MKPVGREYRDKMPRQRCSHSPPEENHNGIKKDLPECVHGGKATNFPEKRHTPLK